MERANGQIPSPGKGGVAAGVPREGTILLRRYRLDSVLYTSGWGNVWVAEDLGMENILRERIVQEDAAPVRIVEVRPEVPRSKRSLRSLRASVHEASQLDCPGLSAARQLFAVGGRYYVLCDPICGETLASLLERSEGGCLPYEELKGLATAMGEVLDHAHERGVANANIRPGSVMVWEDGTFAQLSGFGIHARVGLSRRAQGETWGAFGEEDGTRGKLFAYLAPEIAQHRWEEDDASDQYAFAALMWHALFGAPPPAGGDPVPPRGAKDVAPAAALAALRRAMSAAPRSRFASCGDFARAFCGERVTRHRGMGAQERRFLWRRIRGWVLGIAAAVAALVAVITIFLVTKIVHDNTGAKVIVQERGPAQAGGPIEETQAAVVGAPPLTDCTEVLEKGRNWRASNGMEFVWIPTMKCWVGRFEVTNGEYRELKPDHNSGKFHDVTLDDDRQPVVKLRFVDTVEFAKWFDEREHAAGRLPEGMEARLPDRSEATAYAQAGDERLYPWGDVLPPRFGNYADAALREETGDPALDNYRDSFIGSCPVEYSGENAWGLFGVGGNVWETVTKTSDHSEFGGWHGGGFDTADPAHITTHSVYGYLGNARGTVNGMRLIVAEKAP